MCSGTQGLKRRVSTQTSKKNGLIIWDFVFIGPLPLPLPLLYLETEFAQRLSVGFIRGINLFNSAFSPHFPKVGVFTGDFSTFSATLALFIPAAALCFTFFVPPTFLQHNVTSCDNK